MSEERTLTIGEAATATGLSGRALRFYEELGIVAPLRDAGGRRAFRPEDVAVLRRVRSLKRAGFSLRAIGALLTSGPADLPALVETQLHDLASRQRAMNRAVAALEHVRSRLTDADTPSVSDLCRLIEEGETKMTEAQWNAVYGRYYTEEERREWAAAKAELAEGWSEHDQSAYQDRWEDLGARIAAALPLDPSSDRAQRFLDEWDVLLAPFAEVATPAMRENAGRLWADAPAWRGEVDTAISPEVVAFVSAARKAREVEPSG